MNVSTIFRPPYRPQVLERQIQLPLFFLADKWCLPTSARHHRLPSSARLKSPSPAYPHPYAQDQAPSRPLAFDLSPSLSISHTLLSSFLSSTCADFPFLRLCYPTLRASDMLLDDNTLGSDAPSPSAPLLSALSAPLPLVLCRHLVLHLRPEAYLNWAYRARRPRNFEYTSSRLLLCFTHLFAKFYLRANGRAQPPPQCVLRRRVFCCGVAALFTRFWTTSPRVRARIALATYDWVQQSLNTITRTSFSLSLVPRSLPATASM
ncbi:hypothetical protein B0H16DRAFT_1781561 [Mycena metata]|uniref:Uncharacterized protein n=1 Tax=Mycena metata TaxID=1033252 RepID=A0AAD7MNI3_9AGAR|nr:hypothetical protein B0H16DRAFT_1781561 [Mycena metata]